MPTKYVPGTNMPYAGFADSSPCGITGGMFSLFRPMIRAANGLSLGQVCAITGLEVSTIQNWVKRGFVARPVKKKYHERQLARILLIAALRDCMKIDQIGELMGLINGDTDDESDDIISEDQLYDDLCEAVRLMDDGHTAREEIAAVIRQVTAGYRGPDEGARRRLETALQVMLCAYLSAKLKQEADLCFMQLKAE